MSMTRSLILTFAVLALATSAVAQPTPPFPGRLRPGFDGFRPPTDDQVDDVRPWLNGLGKKQPPKDIDPKLLKDLIEKMPKDKKVDPKQMEQILKDNPQLTNPEFLKQLEKLLKDKDFPDSLQQKLPQGDLGDKDRLKDKLGQLLDAGKKGVHPNKLPHVLSGPKTGQQNVTPPPEAAPSVDKPGVADNEWVKWLDKNFGSAPGSEGAMKDLVAALEKDNGKGSFTDLPDFKSGGLKGLDDFGKPHAGNGWKVRPPDIHGNPPKLGGGGSSWSSGGSGGGGSTFGSGGLGGGTSLAAIAGIAGALFLAILLLRKWKINRDEKASLMAAGAMPIDFDSIRSRAQLVRAFDAVSLEQCGAEARNWNHRVIADRFAATRPAAASPATEVAGLYERARYAPDDEDLTTGEFADARRDLRVLAGATA